MDVSPYSITLLLFDGLEQNLGDARDSGILDGKILSATIHYPAAEQEIFDLDRITVVAGGEFFPLSDHDSVVKNLTKIERLEI